MSSPLGNKRRHWLPLLKQARAHYALLFSLWIVFQVQVTFSSTLSRLPCEITFVFPWRYLLLLLSLMFDEYHTHVSTFFFLEREPRKHLSGTQAHHRILRLVGWYFYSLKIYRIDGLSLSCSSGAWDFNPLKSTSLENQSWICFITLPLVVLWNSFNQVIVSSLKCPSNPFDFLFINHFSDQYFLLSLSRFVF